MDWGCGGALYCEGAEPGCEAAAKWPGLGEGTKRRSDRKPRSYSHPYLTPLDAPLSWSTQRGRRVSRPLGSRRCDAIKVQVQPDAPLSRACCRIVFLFAPPTSASPSSSSSTSPPSSSLISGVDSCVSPKHIVFDKPQRQEKETKTPPTILSPLTQARNHIPTHTHHTHAHASLCAWLVIIPPCAHFPLLCILCSVGKCLSPTTSTTHGAAVVP
jgi:hypothetical protein